MGRILFIANSNLSLSDVFLYFKKMGSQVCWGTFEASVRDALIKAFPRDEIIFIEDPIDFDPVKPGNKFYYKNPGIAEGGFISLFRPDAVVTDVSNRLSRVPKGNEIRVNLFHSFCFKQYVFHESLSNFDLLCLPSFWWKGCFERYGPTRDIPKVVTGYFKHELIIKRQSRRKALRRALGAHTESSRLVLYAPTWGGAGALNWGNGVWARWDEGVKYKYLTCLAKSIKELGGHLILKFHHLATNVDFDYIDGMEGVTLVRDSPTLFADPIDLIVAADILISDVSGMIFEFGITGKPILTIDPSSPEVWECPSIPRSHLPNAPVGTFGELLDSLRRILEEDHGEFSSRCYSTGFQELIDFDKTEFQPIHNIYSAVRQRLCEDKRS